jgi:hypothetical protein
MALTQVDQGLLAPQAQYTGFKNRIINGAMMIDQRNAGASVTPSNQAYTLDRWQTFTSGGGVYTVQQSSTAPSGFSNSLLVTVTTQDSSIAAGDYYILTQKIEGFNTADFNFGTASASAVTLSFQVRSSITGVFSGSIENSAGNRSYPFSYTISSANTWTTASITISGDTTGTWVGATNGAGIVLRLSLGMGSTYQGTANTWNAGDYYATTTETAKLIGTNGATFYITGVQLEKGSTATSFDYRPYGTELALCQRYCPVWSVSGSNVPFASGGGQCVSSTGAIVYLTYPVTPRVSATGVTISGTTRVYTAAASGNSLSSLSYNNSSDSVIQLYGVAGTANLVAGNATSLIGIDAKIIGTGCEL